MTERPRITTKSTTERKLSFTLDAMQHIAALDAYLRRTFAEFRAFKPEEIDYEFGEAGMVEITGYRLEEKPHDKTI